MQLSGQKSGFTLIEVMVVVAVIGALALVMTPSFTSWVEAGRAKDASRGVADLLNVARAEAVRSGVNHLVFFNTDDVGGALNHPAGGVVAGLVAKDDDGDGKPDVGEFVTSIPFDTTGTLSWGTTLASESAPDDPRGVGGSPPATAWTFSKPDNSVANWVLFTPDGTPRAFKTSAFGSGTLGTGAGAVYITNGTRDYAIVLAPLGAVRVHAWLPGMTAWRQ